MTRLQALLTTAVVLAGVAGGINYAYWRRADARGSNPRHWPESGIAGELGAVDLRRRGESGQILSLVRHLSEDPHDAPARFRLAQLYFQQNDYSRSLAELRRLEQERPGDPSVFLQRAMVLKHAGQLGTAEKSVRRALALRPQDGEAQEWLGEIYLDQERNHEALAAFQQCLKSQPYSYFALLGKGRALEQLLLTRHPIPIAAVMEPVEKAVQINPQNPDGLATLARMTLAYLQRPDDAEKLARGAASLDPRSARPFIILAQIALSRPPTPQNLQWAGQYAYEAGRRDLQDPRPPYFIGRVALQQNDPARAVKALERSISLGPMPESVSLLSVAYRRAGSAQRASYYAGIYQQYADLLGRRNALLAAREREPGQVGYDDDLAQLYLEAGEPDTAEYWLKAAQKLRPRDPRRERLLVHLHQLRRHGIHAPLLSLP
jgi:tetratricopeptide (TPR) repeat protein